MVLAALLAAVLFTVSSADAVWASQQTPAGTVAVSGIRSFFSEIFGGKKGAEKNKNLVVVLDAGHGGSDYGASGNGLREKNLTLMIAAYCKAELESYKGVSVYMTRSKDTYVGLNERVVYASSVNADVFVSLHINSAVKTAYGAEVFYPNSNYRPSCGTQGRKLATAIMSNLSSLGLHSRGAKVLNSMNGSTYPDGSLSDYYAVIRGSKSAGFPGIIVEHAFLSNESDAKKFLSTSSSLKKLGIADAKGIAACYGLKKKTDDTDELSKTKIVGLVGKSSANAALQWEEVEGASGYEIYRSSSQNGKYARVATVKKASVTSYQDKSVKKGKSYYYKVRPYKGSGNNKKVASFCTAQKVKLLPAPAFSVKSQSASRIKVSWKKVSGAKSYEVYRSSSKNGKYAKIATVKDAASYLDTKRKAGSSYYYKVRAAGGGIQGKTYSSFSGPKWASAK